MNPTSQNPVNPSNWQRVAPNGVGKTQQTQTSSKSGDATGPIKDDRMNKPVQPETRARRVQGVNKEAANNAASKVYADALPVKSATVDQSKAAALLKSLPHIPEKKELSEKNSPSKRTEAADPLDVVISKQKITEPTSESDTLTLDNKLKESKTKMKELKTKMTEAENNFEKIKNKKDAVAAELKQCKEKADQANLDLDRAISKIDEIEKNLQGLKEDEKRWQPSNGKFKDDTARIMKNLEKESLQKDLDAAAVRWEQLDKKFDEALNLKTNKEKEFNSLVSELNGWEKKYDELQNDYQDVLRKDYQDAAAEQLNLRYREKR